MIKFISFKSSGEIVGSGVCPENMLSLQADPAAGVFVMPSNADWGRNYVDSGRVVPMPPQPSDDHIFDYVEKAWVDPRTLDVLKLAKWSEIRLAREETEFGGFTWQGRRFDSDQISQGRITGAVQLAQLDPEFVIDWTLADNTVVLLDAAQMQEVGIALGSHVSAQHARARLLREQINAATKAAQLADICWPEKTF